MVHCAVNIPRTYFIDALHERLKSFPIVALLGPRQCGKTTLAKQYLVQTQSADALFLDCENPRDLAILTTPMAALEAQRGLVVIDEIQRRPELFPVLRVLADGSTTRRFLILGSASRDLIRQGSETLAGRISFIELTGFSLEETGFDQWEKLWIRGGFPRSFLAENDAVSVTWREDFIRTFLERDVPNLGIQIPAAMLSRFWAMLSHYHGQVFPASEIGRSLQIADTTARRYLDLLTGTFLIRQLKPWYYNTSKRIVKRPKLYFRDSGLLHALMSVSEKNDLLHHPRHGASWEGFALEQVIHALRLSDDQVYFWAVHTGAELDLVFQKRGKTWGIEIKWTDSPSVTRSIRSGMEELGLEHVWIVHPGDRVRSLESRVTATGLRECGEAFRDRLF
jgi:predicted AAA+ superfamily ATPase